MRSSSWFFFTLELEAESFDFTCSSGTQKQSRRITAAPLPVLSVGQCPLSAHQTQPGFHLWGNDSLNKNLNLLKSSLFWDISTFLCFLPGASSLAWSNAEIFQCLHNGPVLPLCTLGMEMTELWLNHNADFLCGTAHHRDHLGISVQERNVKKTFIKFLARLTHLQLWEGMTRCPKMLRFSVMSQCCCLGPGGLKHGRNPQESQKLCKATEPPLS